MITRTCKLGEACTGGRIFQVRFPSDTKEFCSRRCQGTAVAAARGVGANRANGISGGQATGDEARRHRSVEFIDGLTPLEVLDTGIRLGYLRRIREVSGEPLGEVGKLTHEALWAGKWDGTHSLLKVKS